MFFRLGALCFHSRSQQSDPSRPPSTPGDGSEQLMMSTQWSFFDLLDFI